mgnify:CR=1 FL=1
MTVLPRIEEEPESHGLKHYYSGGLMGGVHHVPVPKEIPDDMGLILSGMGLAVEVIGEFIFRAVRTRDPKVTTSSPAHSPGRPACRRKLMYAPRVRRTAWTMC